MNTIRHNKGDGGMSIFKTFFLKFKSASKTFKKIFNEPNKLNQICLLSHENFC